MDFFHKERDLSQIQFQQRFKKSPDLIQNHSEVIIVTNTKPYEFIVNSW